ncbi:MAG: 16S rRNA processing protein RimM [Deltaproteobacteria bacterium]|nr:16S rRNA processing protein RimM [Deltaproteobacteria bacterium]
MRLLNNPDTPDGVLIGKITGAHGIRGVVKVISYADSIIVFEVDGPLLLFEQGGSEQTYRIRWTKPHKSGLLISFSGVSDREAAERLIGSTIHLPKSALKKLDEGTYYWFELMGLAVYEDERYLGILTSIMPTGSNDVYVVTDPDRGSDYEVLIPALSSVVDAIDLDNGKMQVCLPKGLGRDDT